MDILISISLFTAFGVIFVLFNLVLIAFVMGVMFTGYATATEAAAFGVLGALLIAWWSRSLTRENFWSSLMGATRLSCKIHFILAGAACVGAGSTLIPPEAMSKGDWATTSARRPGTVTSSSTATGSRSALQTEPGRPWYRLFFRRQSRWQDCFRRHSRSYSLPLSFRLNQASPAHGS